MTCRFLLTASVVASLAAASVAHAQTPPPAPVQVAPAAGAALVQPITIRWGAVVDPDGPIGNYTWQVGTSATFGTVILSGFTQQSLPGIPVPTEDRLSGLPLGTYFWRVKASQTVGGAVFAIESPWSTVRSFTVAAFGSEPETPSFTSPANGTQIHVSEFFTIAWTPVANAEYYLLEADDQPSFSYPLAFTGAEAMQFGTKFRAGWGNAIPNIYYRVRAVTADGVRGLPSPTLNVTITNAAPFPAAPALVSPVGGATVSIPFTFDWTDTVNPQDAGYDLDIDDEPNFQGTFGVFLVQNVSRSDYMITETLPPGTYFWRIRSVHGQVRGPWSAGGSFRLVAPSTPPGLQVQSIIPAPSAVYGTIPTQARVTLNMPAPAGGVVVKIASDFAQANTPTSVVVPAGSTDAIVSPITSVPVTGASVGTIRAALGLSWQQSSLAVFPLLWGMAFSEESVIGGDALTGTVTLLNPAPPGGITVKLASGNISLLTPPASVFIPAGATGATFNIATAPVSAAARIILDTGTSFGDYRAFSNWVTLMPPGSPEPPASLSDVTLAAPSVAGGAKTTGTVTLTAPAPAGGAVVRLSGSMEGQVVVPPSVTVPAGSTSASFTITAPQVPAPFYVAIQASYSSLGVSHVKLLEIVPGSGAATLQGFSVSPTAVVGGSATTGSVLLVVPASLGGGLVTLTSENPSLVQVPASISVPAGNSAASFTITTSPVAAFTVVRVDASAGGVTRSEFISLGASASAPTLQSVTLGVGSVAGGTSVSGTVTLSGAAPAGGTSVSLSTSNSAAAQVTPAITVPAGQTQATFSVTTSTVSANTPVTITAFQGSTTRSASLTVLAGSTQPPASVTVTLSGVPASLRRGQSFTATAAVANTGGSAASGLSVVVSFTPSSSLRLNSPTSSSQSLTAVAAGATRSVSWQIKADKAATATLTMTVRNASGTTLGTASRTVTITN